MGIRQAKNITKGTETKGKDHKIKKSHRRAKMKLTQFLLKRLPPANITVAKVNTIESTCLELINNIVGTTPCWN